MRAGTSTPRRSPSSASFLVQCDTTAARDHRIVLFSIVLFSDTRAAAIVSEIQGTLLALGVVIGTHYRSFLDRLIPGGGMRQQARRVVFEG
jgi:hypothetical protein